MTELQLFIKMLRGKGYRRTKSMAGIGKKEYYRGVHQNRLIYITLELVDNASIDFYFTMEGKFEGHD